MLGGIKKALFGSGGEGDASAALEAIRNVPLPVLKEYYPELYKQVVQMNPELETAVTLGPSAMEGVSTDPALKQAQLKALQKLQGISDAGGMDAQFMADQARLETDVNTNLQAQQGAIMQNLATRGMSGGGNELVARQMAAQQAANRQAQSGMDLKAQAERRALEALMQSGQLAGNMQSQDFGQQSSIAQAKDAINKFNVQNQQQIIGNNVGMKNNAQLMNANNAQNVANQNTGLKNQQQLHNNGLSQQNFNNQMAKATGVANQYSNIADRKDKERAGDMALVGNLIGAGANAYAGSK